MIILLHIYIDHNWTIIEKDKVKKLYICKYNQ